jgi:hypothetical protein
MPIIRGKHQFEENFVQIPNRWLRDNRLSLKSLGLLAQLTTHSVGWKVTIKTLAIANNCGQEQIRTAIYELEEHGYLERRQQRSAGRFSEAIWITKDPSPITDSPITENPIPVNPIPENPIHKNTNNKNTIDKNTISKYFDRFWDLYPRKIGITNAERAFYKALTASPDGLDALAEQIIAGAERTALDPNLPDKQFVPHPSTWLNRKGWLDEAYPEREISKEEKLARDRAASEIRRQKEIDRTRRELEEMSKADTSLLLCDHGKTIALCVPCSKSLADGN